MTLTAVAHPDDRALLSAVAAGDQTAVARMLDEVAPIVYGFVLARVGSQTGAAEDLLQETLLEGLRSQAGFRGDSLLSTWLCTIARRQIARHYERERRSELARSGLTQVPTIEEDMAEDEVDQRAEILAALGRLPVLHRQVLVLKYLDGLPVAQIASTVGKTDVQVQSLLQRARDGLRRELESGRE
jgi:RNA polymerase sigma-70 factor (ECF subfamily)